MRRCSVEVWLYGKKLGVFSIDNPALCELKRIVEKAGYKIEMRRVSDDLILWLI